MTKKSRICVAVTILPFFISPFLGLVASAEGEIPKTRGEIRVVESWRPDINVLGHNVLQYLFECALDRNELKRRIKDFRGRFRLDFTEDYLNSLSVDRLRHILLAALINAKPHN